MDTSRIFQDLGIDAIIGTQLLDMLELSTDELVIPQRFNRFKSVIDFLKQFPEDTQRFLINKTVRSKAVDRLNHFFEYSELLKQKGEYEKMIDSINTERSVVNDKTKEIELSGRLTEISSRLQNLKEEINIYEK